MKKTTLLLGCLLAGSMSFAQEQETELTTVEKLEQQTQSLESAVKSLQKLKISGYVQAQYQDGQKDASLNVGTANSDKAHSFNRVGIRRGRIKFTYEEGIASGVFQLDITEKGVGFKDAYLNVKDPWFKTNALRAGIFDRPFGFEISYSSSRRESPERSRVFTTLFPEERDLGAMLILQAPKTSPWNILKLEAGLFAGNGIKQETDNRKDFIGHLSVNKTLGSENRFGAGVSYYHGSVYQGTDKVYKMDGHGFVLNDNPSNKGAFAKREYYGFDAQFNTTALWGMTQLRGEYLFGTQPGSLNGSKSPNSSSLPTSDTYLRKFSGGYVMLVQDLGSLPLSAVVKFDWYDPNTKVSKDEIGLNHTGSGDIAYDTWGFGLLWRINKSLRLQTYYDLIKNETSSHLASYETNRKDNVLTVRLQYKF